MNDDGSRKNEKNSILKAIYILGTVFIVIFAIANKASLSGWWSKIQSVLNPVVIGFVIAYLINPLYRTLSGKIFGKIKKEKLRSGISLVITYIIVLAALSFLIGSIIPQVVTSYKDLESKFSSYLQAAIDWANGFIQNSNLFNGEYADVFDFIDTNDLQTKLSDFIIGSGNVLKTVFNYILAYGSNFIVGLKDVFMGLLISVYVLIFKKHIANMLKRLIRAFTSRDRYETIIKRTNEVDKKFGNFIVGKIIDSIIIGILTFVLLCIFSIPYAPLVSVIVGVTNIIPVFGPFLGAVPSAFIIFIASPSKALVFILLIIIIQQLDGNLIGPMILGPSMGLTAFGIVIAITIMGGLWGIPGMLIGVPLFAAIYDIISENVSARLKNAGDPEFPAVDTDAESQSKKDSKLVTAIKNGAKRAADLIKNKFGKNNNGGTKNGRK